MAGEEDRRVVSLGQECSVTVEDVCPRSAVSQRGEEEDCYYEHLSARIRVIERRRRARSDPRSIAQWRR